MAAVGVHLVEPEAAVVLEAEDDPASVGRVGADERVDLAPLVVREEAQVGPVGTDGGDVRGVAGVGEVGVVDERQVPAVGCPVLLDADVEAERRELELLAAVDAAGEQRLRSRCR